MLDTLADVRYVVQPIGSIFSVIVIAAIVIAAMLGVIVYVRRRMQKR